MHPGSDLQNITPTGAPQEAPVNPRKNKRQAWYNGPLTQPLNLTSLGKRGRDSQENEEDAGNDERGDRPFIPGSKTTWPVGPDKPSFGTIPSSKTKWPVRPDNPSFGTFETSRFRPFYDGLENFDFDSLLQGHDKHYYWPRQEPPKPPPPSIGYGPNNLFGGIMASNPTQGNREPAPHQQEQGQLQGSQLHSPPNLNLTNLQSMSSNLPSSGSFMSKTISPKDPRLILNQEGKQHGSGQDSFQRPSVPNYQLPADSGSYSRLAPFAEDSKASGDFGGSSFKRRQGYATLPNRCHSCGRAETPEWRRGPDGAKTLCNSCGLHYAKLRTYGRPKSNTGSLVAPKAHPPQLPPLNGLIPPEPTALSTTSRKRPLIKQGENMLGFEGTVKLPPPNCAHYFPPASPLANCKTLFRKSVHLSLSKKKKKLAS